MLIGLKVKLTDAAEEADHQFCDRTATQCPDKPAERMCQNLIRLRQAELL